jgi:hypothetical protein
MVRRVIALTLVAVAALAFAPPLVFDVRAAQVGLVGQTWNIKNETGSPATDFHITVAAAGAVTIPPSENDIGKDRFRAVRIEAPTIGGFRVEFSDPANPILADDTIEIAIKFKSSANEFKIADAFWTFRGVKIPVGKQPKLPNFKVHNSDTIYTVSNETDAALLIEDLQFQIVSGEVPLELLRPFVLDGFGSSQPSFLLEPGESMDFMPGDLAPGQFLLAQLKVVDPSDPTSIIPAIQEHEAVPMGPTLALLSFGLAALAAAAVRFGSAKAVWSGSGARRLLALDLLELCHGSWGGGGCPSLPVIGPEQKKPRTEAGHSAPRKPLAGLGTHRDEDHHRGHLASSSGTGVERRRRRGRG